MYTLDDALEDLRAEVCFNCNEYKGMVTDPDTGDRYCIFCS